MWKWLLRAVGGMLLLAPLGAYGAGTPNLPEVPFDYEGYVNNLPSHFTNDGPSGNSVISFDNTPPFNPVTNAGTELGRVLFYDKRLSHNNSVACASCHHQENGFSDPNRLSVGFDGEETARHSMGLTNAAFHPNGRMFWDERAPTLEQQVLQPIQDPVEMGMNLNDLRIKIENTTFYGDLFTNAFGDAAVTDERIAHSLAQFVRSLVSYESKFDSAFDQNGVPDFAATFTPPEQRGHSLFNGRGRCSSCHQSNAHVGNFFTANNGLDAFVTDEGAGDGRFKVPSLRNIEVREGYMHDGRFATVAEVLEFYSSGIQVSPNLDPRLRALAPGDGDPVGFFSASEREDLEAFLSTLTDWNFLSNEMFSDPFGSACDVDNNGQCDVSDLDRMLANGPLRNAVTVDASGNELFDLNGDGLIDQADVGQWLTKAALENGFAAAYLPGDANLDGFVDASDLNQWNQNRFDASTDWSRGDFNGDGFVDISDLNIWNANKFQSSDAQSVPEPSSWILLLLVVLTSILTLRPATSLSILQ